MINLPGEKYDSDFEGLVSVLTGTRKPERVNFIELGVDYEIKKYIIEEIFGESWVDAEEDREGYLDQLIFFNRKMGYDFVRMVADWENLPQFKERKTTDTAIMTRGERSWVEEGGGIIKDWDDFDKVDWDQINFNLSNLHYIRHRLPSGMKIMVGTTLFEMILEKFLGYEDLFLLSYDNPELVEAILKKWGEKVYEFYKETIKLPEVGGIFHADDLGDKNSTLINPDFLRKNVFPWFKKYAALVHEQDKIYLYHCCGNVQDVMEDLIEDVKIDAFHSFQDLIIPVTEFDKKYGDRIAALGGIDMDKLGRLDEKDLRDYVRTTLEQCMPGRFALGSGNTIANYIPPKNYFIMLEEGLNWE